jgi:hypothetical protein
MWLDLSSIWIPLNAEAFNEPLRYLDPVFVGVCNFMCVQVANSPIELALGDDPLDLPNLLLKPIGKVT